RQQEPLGDVEAAADRAEEPVAGFVDVVRFAVPEPRVEEELEAELDEGGPVLVEVELPVQRDREAEAEAVLPVTVVGPPAIPVPARPVEVGPEVDVDGVVDRRDEAVVQDGDAEAGAAGEA